MLKSVIIYMTSFAVSIYFGWRYEKWCKNNENTTKLNIKKFLWFLVIMAAPIIISTIRVNVGTDYFNYYSRFLDDQSAGIFSLFSNPEPLFSLMNIIAGILFGDYWGSLLFSSLLINLLIIAAIDYHKKDISIPISQFIYFMIIFSVSLNIVRQTIAVSIILYSYRYILEKRFFKYAFLIIIATLFHNTSIICLLFYVFSVSRTAKYERSKRTVYYPLLILSPLIVIGITQLTLNVSFFSKYFIDYSIDFSNFGVGILIDIIPLLLPLLLFKRTIHKYGYDSLFNIYLLVIPLKIAGYINIYANRLAYDVSILLIILYSLIISKITQKRDKIVVSVVVIIYLLFTYVYYIIYQNQNEIYPYISSLF